MMRLAPRERLTPALVVAAPVAALPGLVLVLFGDIEVHLSAQVHFFSVGFSALVAAAAAAALTIAGATRGDRRTVLVGTAFAVMGSLLALHGLSTPGVLFGQNGVVAFTGGATLPVGGGVLALSVFPMPFSVRGVKPLLYLGGALPTVVIPLGVSGHRFPHL